MTSFIESTSNNIIIDGINYTREILCNDIELIQNLQKLGRLDPNKEPKDYSIDCSKTIIINEDIKINTEKNRVGIEYNENKHEDQGIGTGTFNTLYKIGKYNVINKPDETEEKELVIRITNNKKNVTDNIKNNEINGLFLQHYISKNCPYVCKVYEFGYLKNDNDNDNDKRVYAILECLKTPDLITYLMFLNKENNEPNKNNEPNNYKKLIHQVLIGLKCMNDDGFVHLDIKLENIGIDNDGNAKIFDFGFARYLNEDPTDLNNNENPFGTDFYADPEIIFLKKIYKKSDIYSLGSLLYQSIFSDNTKSTFLNDNGRRQYNYIFGVHKLNEKFNLINDNKNYYIPLFREPIELKENKEMIVKKESINLIYKYDIDIIKTLIKKMMKYDAHTRIPFEDLLNDDWFNDDKDKDRMKAYMKAEEDAKLKAEEDARLKAEAAAKLKAEKDAKLKAKEDARLKAEEDARLKKIKMKAEKPILYRFQKIFGPKGGKHLSKKIIYKKNKYKPETLRSRSNYIKSNRSNKCNKKCSKRKKYGNAYSTLRKTKRMNKWYNL